MTVTVLDSETDYVIISGNYNYLPLVPDGVVLYFSTDFITGDVYVNSYGCLWR